MIFFIFISNFSFGQPNPQERYPERIKAITEQLKIDSLNYELIWERLKMKVNLMGSFPPLEEIFSFQVDSFKIRRRELFFDEFNSDFIKIYDNIIQLKYFENVEEGDFYLNRIWFYFNMLEFDRAIEDAIYLRDKASYSRFWQRGEYYNDWAISSLFNLYALKKDYDKALETINFKLEKQKNESPKLYYSLTQNSYNQKIQLYEHFDKREEIIPYLKQLCRENFLHYFEIAKYKGSNFENTVYVNDKEHYTDKNDYNYFTNRKKDQSFYLLKLLVDYMKKNKDKELPKYEKIYNQLHYRMNENYETINPNISDKELKLIVAEI